MGKTGRLVVYILGCEAVGWVSSIFTVSAIPTWYAALSKPAFSPPNWVFAPVWTALYAMMGVSFYLIWLQKSQKKRYSRARVYFFIQLWLNFLWSLLFFGFHAPLVALVDILLLLVAILVTIREFYPLSRTAAYLLIPYMLWVAFASMLNTAIVVLNP